jgi:hypothetical protein
MQSWSLNSLASEPFLLQISKLRQIMGTLSIDPVVQKGSWLSFIIITAWKTRLSTLWKSSHFSEHKRAHSLCMVGFESGGLQGGMVHPYIIPNLLGYSLYR